MIKKVGPVRGAVATFPEILFSLRAPSGLDTTHDDTPFAFQKIDVRAPDGTDTGTAQMSALDEVD